MRRAARHAAWLGSAALIVVLAAAAWRDYQLRVRLDQELLVLLEDQSRWALRNDLATATEIPNCLGFIHPDALAAVRRQAVTIIY